MNSLIFRTPERHGYAVEFSPFQENRLACSCGQNFGISGNGSLFIIDLTVNGPVAVRVFDWSDALFDVTWSESDPNLAVTAGGDGGIQLWNVTQPQGPIRVFKEHSKEVHCVDWSLTRDAQLVLSASWDQTIKMWDVTHSASLSTFTGHDSLVYGAIWSPRITGCFATVSGDHTLRVWDVKKTHMAQIVIPAHDAEVLTCDWSRYDQHLIMTGAVDSTIRGWDIRNPRQPLFQLQGHNYAIRRLKCSPFEGSKLISCSYDKTVRLWDFQQQQTPVETVSHHTEFVCGVDYNLHLPGQIADCSWDQTVRVYGPQSLLQPGTPSALTDHSPAGIISQPPMPPAPPPLPPRPRLPATYVSSALRAKQPQTEPNTPPVPPR